MKPTICPRCEGTGIIEEDSTLVGIAPLLERPSVVNDEAWVWDGGAREEEPTVVQRTPLRLSGLPKAPGLEEKLGKPLYDSDKPTRVVPVTALEFEAEIEVPASSRTPIIPPEPRTKPRRTVSIAALLVALAFGVAAGVLAAERGLHLFQRLQMQMSGQVEHE